jgi:hypothetical protein
MSRLLPTWTWCLHAPSGGENQINGSLAKARNPVQARSRKVLQGRDLTPVPVAATATATATAAAPTGRPLLAGPRFIDS